MNMVTIRQFLFRAAAIVSGFGALAILLLSVRAYDVGDWWLFSACWLSFGLVSALYAAADHMAVVAKARWSGPLTSHQIASISKKEGFYYGLYLRPLNTDAELRTSQTLNPFQILMPNMGMPFIEIQDWLFRAAPRNWRFFSEGGLTTNVRPVEILDSGDWFEDIKVVGAFADVIVLVAGTSPGIILEMDHFLRTKTHKVVLIAPPREGNEQYFARIKDVKNEVLQTISQAREQGELMLPVKPHPDGKLFFASYPFTPRNLRKALLARARAASESF